MADAKIDIIVGAEVNAGIANMNKFTTSLVKTEQTAEKFSNKTKSNFTGLNRVIQDLPFGFLAIQNNLEQLFPAAGSLGLTISIITSAITFLQVGLRNWTRHTKEVKAATDEFVKSLKSAEQSALSTGIQLQGFVNIAKDSTQSLTTRNNALREANDILGDHAKKLTLVNINTQEATNEINNFTQALINQSLATKYADKVADLLIKQKDAAKDYGKVLKVYKTDSAAAADALNSMINAEIGDNSARAKAALSYKDATKAATNYKEVTKELHDTFQEFTQLQVKGLTVKIPPPPKAKKTKLNPFDYFTFDPNITKTDFDPKAFFGTENMTKLVGENGILNITPTVRVKPNLDLDYLQQRAEDMSAILTQTVSDSFVAISEGLGSVLTGKGNFFDGVLKIMGEGLEQLGKYVITTSTLIASIRKALNAAFIGNPILGIAAGVALVALGSVLKNIPKFASGGVVSQPTLAMVGENGPERITPIGYEGSANNVMQGEVVFSISGQNLRGILKRADKAAYYSL